MSRLAHHTNVRHTALGTIVAACIALGLLVGLGTPASAGGWAVGSLDAVPIAEPGAAAVVGFTVLQHGVTPADLTDDVGIEIVNADGTAQFFPATNDGVPGHYVAEVTFPGTSGSYEWNIRMGWFGPQPLGTLDVSTPAVSDATGSSGADTSDIRWLMVAGIVALAGVAIADLALTRRRTGRMALG